MRAATHHSQPSTSAGGGEFTRLTAPLRGELLAFCYRMLGSVHEAEDAVQETYLRAWRFYGQFDGRSTLRTWLYRIATRVCLRAAERANRRPLPSQLAAPSREPEAPASKPLLDVPWLQPFPDRSARDAEDPAAIVERRDDMRLALIAALQLLSSRQRAILILRDVLDWRAAEIADVLNTSPAAVNSMLQRARARLAHAQPDRGSETPLGSREQDLLNRYAQAFATADVTALTRVLTEDATWEMPPYRTWFTGRDNITRFLATRLAAPGHTHMIKTSANGQPAFAQYIKDRQGVPRAHAVHLLTPTKSGITQCVAFLDPSVFAILHLPMAYPPG